MLAIAKYPQAYVDSCRAHVGARVAAWDALDGDTAALEPLFFNDLALVLELQFVHRLRKDEGKDGNPANEVRLLASSLIEHDGVLTFEKSLKLKPDTSVLGLAEGDAIALDRDPFVALAEAFYGQIEKAFLAA